MAESRNYPFRSTWSFFTGYARYIFRAKWRHRVKSCHCYLSENLVGMEDQGSFHKSVTFMQIYYNCFPGGVPNTDLFLLQPNNCNIATVSFLKIKSNPKAPLNSFGSPLPTWWNSKFFIVWFHLPPYLPPYSVHTLIFHKPSNVCIRSLYTMCLWNLFWESMELKLQFPSINIDCNIDHHMAEYLKMACFCLISWNWKTSIF